MISLPPHSDPMLRFQVHPHEKTEKEAGGGGVVGFTHSRLRILKEYLIGCFPKVLLSKYQGKTVFTSVLEENMYEFPNGKRTTSKKQKRSAREMLERPIPGYRHWYSSASKWSTVNLF